MAVQKPDVIEGARIVERGGQILELDRVYHFSDLDFESDAGAKVLTDALQSAPPTGSVHPSHSSPAQALRLEDRVVGPVGHNQARMTLTYRWNPTSLQIVDAGAAIEAVITELDSPDKLTAQPIRLIHPALPPDTTGTRQQGAQVNVTTARPFAIGVVTIQTPGGVTSIINHITLYVNTLNKGTFLGGEPLTWLITDGTFQPVSRTATGVVNVARFTFTFQHKPEKWQPIDVVAIRPLDGLPFPDAGESTAPGAKIKLDWYLESDFSKIGMLGSGGDGGGGEGDGGEDPP